MSDNFLVHCEFPGQIYIFFLVFQKVCVPMVAIGHPSLKW